MSSRRIEDLVPELQVKFRLFASICLSSGIDFMVTCTLRPQIEQDALYAQGRTKPGKIITWTRKSRHSEGRAFDIAILANGKIVWDTSYDADHDTIPEYLEAGIIGETVGLIWGGRWKGKPDFCHFELPELPEAA